RIRWRTFSPSSSFLNRSAAFSGSRWPWAHWPWPRWVRDGMCPFLLLWEGRARGQALTRAGGDWGSAAGGADGAGDPEQVNVKTAHQGHLAGYACGAGHGASSCLVRASVTGASARLKEISATLNSSGQPCPDIYKEWD